MKFILGGEGSWEWLERIAYRGAIGIFYDDTLSGVLAFLIFAIVCILAVIGLITVLKRIFFGKRPKETPGERWMRTGRTK